MDFERAFSQLSQHALNLARQFSRNPATQDDLEQAGLLVILEVSEYYPNLPETEFIQVTKTAMRNRMTDHYRREKKYELHYGRHTSDNKQPEPGVNYIQPVDLLIADETYEKLKGQIPESMHMTLALISQGAGLREIAEKTGAPYSTVQYRLKYIRQIAESA